MKLTLRFLIFVVFILSLAVQVFSQVPISIKSSQAKPRSVAKIKPARAVTSAHFKAVDSLALHAKPAKALELIHHLYDRSRATHNTPMLIKSVLYRMMFTSYLEEDVFQTIIDDLRANIKVAKQPEKSVLQSLLGQTYWNYGNRYRYQLSKRSDIAGDKAEDFKTWSVKRLNDETIGAFMASLKEEDILQRTSIGLLKEVLTGDSAIRYLRPSLYDLLAHNALAAFTDTRIEVALPQESQSFFDHPLMMADYREFIKASFPVDSGTVFSSNSLQVFRSLLKFHARDKDLSALADADLKRIKFIYNRSDVADREKLYFRALGKMASEYIHTPILSTILYEQALHLKNTGTEDKMPVLPEVLRLSRKAIEAYPLSVGARNAENLIREIEQPQLNIEMNKFSLPETRPLLHINYKNIDSVYLRIYQLTAAEADTGLNVYHEKAYTAFFNKHAVLKAWKVGLPAFADYQEHSYLDRVVQLPQGHYLLVADIKKINTDSVVNSGYNLFSLSNIAVTSRATSKKDIEYFLMNSNDGSVLQGAAFRAISKNKSLITFEKDSLYINTGNNYYFANKEDEDRVLMYTDRPIYRPGQTVYYKGIYISRPEKSYTVASGMTLDINMKDVNGEIIDTTVVSTNDFGSFKGSFTIPAGKLNGQMRIETRNGSVSFAVEEYKRPGFEIKINNPSRKYSLKDSINIEGLVQTLAGYPLEGAKIRYNVVRYVFSNKRLNNQRSASGSIASGSMFTAAGGTYKITFSPGTTDELNNYLYQVTIDVTSQSGETQSIQKGINLGRADRVLTVTMPGQIFLKHAKDTVAVSIASMNGLGLHRQMVQVNWYPLTDSGRLTFWHSWNHLPEKYALSKKEFTAAYPYEPYAAEYDPSQWESGKSLLQEQITPVQGKAFLHLKQTDLPEGYYKVGFKVNNNEYDTATVYKILRIYPAVAVTIKTAQEWLVEEPATVEGGSVFRLASILPMGKAWYEIWYRGKSMGKVMLNVTRKQQLIHIKPRPEFTGEFAVQFTMVQGGRLFNQLKVIPVQNELSKLNIQFISFRNKLQPGQKESWKLKITDKKGEKVPSEMAVTLYDSALDRLQPMTWERKLAPVANYYTFNWLSEQNASSYYQHFWFMDSNNAYLPFQQNNYEQINLLDVSYSGGGDSGYSAYMEKLSHSVRIKAAGQAIRQLARLKEGQLVYGIISEKSGALLPGVILRSGKTSAITDQYGIYKIKLKPGDQLRVTYLGFKTKILTIGKLERLDIELSQEEHLLEERMVVGYGISSNVNLRGNSMLAKQDITQALSGKVEGITVVDDKTYDFISIETYDPKSGLAIINGKPVRSTSVVPPRTNFKETAFFYPQLRSNEAGEIDINFTLPESVTRYKMLGLAHTKDMKTSLISRDIIAEKKVAVLANAPRYFREGDTVMFTAGVSNLLGTKLSGTASIEFRDALSGIPVKLLVDSNSNTQNFDVVYKGTATLKWQLTIPAGLNAVTYKVLVTAGNYSDGEEMTIPILPNSILLTESMSLNVRGKSSKTFSMDRLLKSATATNIRSQSLTFEYTANPIWNAVQALPYLMEFTDECSEQTFNRFFANSLATEIVSSYPRIKNVLNSWMQSDKGNIFISELEKNPELKSALLQETPWVLSGETETERRKHMATLLNMAKMRSELGETFIKLEKMQHANGSFSWFTGMDEDRYITQYIALGIGKIKQLPLFKSAADQDLSASLNAMGEKAMSYLDSRFVQDQRSAHFHNSMSELEVNYLLTRSYFNTKNLKPNVQRVYTAALSKLLQCWKTMSVYQQAQAALILSRNGNRTEATKIIDLLKDRAKYNDESGMYWPDNQNGSEWYQDKIETHALLISAFEEVAHDDTAVSAMKTWLMKNKQTNDWKNTKATAAACYALLNGAKALLEEGRDPEIRLGGQNLSELIVDEPVNQVDVGYQKIVLPARKIKAGMGKVEIKNNNISNSWGALHWQYFQQLDQVSASDNGIRINKQLFLKQGQSGTPSALQPVTAATHLHTGDLLRVRIEIYAHRDFQYLHLKDMRSAGFEPVNIHSRYQYQDGLSYYESSKDVSTNFFISEMPKGVYVLEYDLRVTHTGNFSNGITSLQSMYAPEFNTYSSGIRVKVEN